MQMAGLIVGLVIAVFLVTVIFQWLWNATMPEVRSDRTRLRVSRYF